MRSIAKTSQKKKISLLGPAVGVMTMSLDSHVVDHGSSPGPGGLNSHQVCVRARPRSQEENGEGIVAWPSPLGGDFLLSVSLSLTVSISLSLMSACTLKQKPLKSKQINKYIFFF